MKRKTFIAMLCAVAVSLLFGNCKGDDYLLDSGTSSPYFDGTIWEYLNAEPQYTQYFSELVDVIEYAGMEDVFKNEEITFFAPTTQSINSSLRTLSNYNYALGGERVTDIRQVKAEVWKDFLSLYIIPGKYTLNDIPQVDTTAIAAYPGQAYICYDGSRAMNIGVDYGEANGVKYAGYRMLIYSYVNDFSTMDMINAKVATCNLQPTNGVVHVIRFTDHAFGFNSTTFRQKALDEGLNELSGDAEDEDTTSSITLKQEEHHERKL